MTATIIPFKRPQAVTGVPVLGRNGELVKKAWLLHDIAQAWAIDLRPVMAITKGERPPTPPPGK